MTSTSAYVSTVNADRTIIVPEAIPIGAKVAIVLLPLDESQEEKTIRYNRFRQVLDAINAAIESNYETPDISDTELNRLIREARQSAGT